MLEPQVHKLVEDGLRTFLKIIDFNVSLSVIFAMTRTAREMVEKCLLPLEQFVSIILPGGAPVKCHFPDSCVYAVPSRREQSGIGPRHVAPSLRVTRRWHAAGLTYRNTQPTRCTVCRQMTQQLFPPPLASPSRCVIYSF